VNASKRNLTKENTLGGTYKSTAAASCPSPPNREEKKGTLQNGHQVGEHSGGEGSLGWKRPKKCKVLGPKTQRQKARLLTNATGGEKLTSEARENIRAQRIDG